MTALELIGAHGTRHDLSSLLKWCELAETERRVSRTMRAGFEASLGNLLERGVPSSFELSQLYRAAHLSLVPSILECVGQRPSEDHLLMLSDCLGSVPEADSLVLAEIGQQAKFLHHPIEVISRERVRSYLQNKSAGLLVGGILAAEQMEDTGAIRELTRLLTHEDRNVKERALIALKSISTEQLGRDPEAWNEWHASAQAWWNERAPTLMREVEDPSASIASRAVLELSKHRFFRHQLAEPVARGLNHSESEVVILTCATLGHLGSPQSVPLLLERLTDHKLEIRRAALQALRRLTGADYGEEPEGWRKAGW